MKPVFLVGRLCIAFFLLVLVLLIVYIIQRLAVPRCAGTFDPNQRWCRNGKLVTTSVEEQQEGCKQEETEGSYTFQLTQFSQYLLRVESEMEANKRLSSFFSRINEWTRVTQGHFLFAVPELLKVLPTDFGQNYVTPYGMISFFASYPPCISDTQQFCQTLFAPTGSTSLTTLCQSVFKSLQKTTSSCPFSLTDQSREAWIQDKGFFNVLGTLGAFSLSPTQAVVLFVDLPVADLKLNYWSFMMYLADSYDPEAQCTPYRQVQFASLSSALNMFTAVAVSGKRFNPLTAQQGTVVKGHVRFYLILSSRVDLVRDIETQLRANPPYPLFDFIYTFTIPSGKGSVKLDPGLPNPNSIEAQDPAFHPAYQRLACFLRLSPSVEATPDSLHNIQQFIYQKGPYTHQFDCVLLESLSGRVNPPLLFSKYTLPAMIVPMVDEVQRYRDEFECTSRQCTQTLFWKGYRVSKLATRNSTLNIFAPLDRTLLQTKHPYLGGYQAIQVAGNGQGDNYDAQYRLSQGTCLTDDDVLMALCMNHCSVQNVLYNSINVVDVNKAYGYGSAVLDHSFPCRYYVVLAGRNLSLLNQTKQHLRARLDPNVQILTLPMRTGSSLEEGVPLCHSLLMVERVYLNTTYPSIEDPTRLYRLMDLFGNSFQDLLVDHETTSNDAWASLINVVGPQNHTMISPKYWKASFSVSYWQTLVLVSVVVASVVTVACGTAWAVLLFSKHRNKRMSSS